MEEKFLQKIPKFCEKQLNLELEKNENLKKLLLHNKFGCLCLQGGNHEKARTHLNKAIELFNNGQFDFKFSNVYMNLANLYGQEKNFDSAIENYQKVLQFSPFRIIDAEDKENTQFISNQNFIQWSPQLNSFQAYVDAYTNLAVMYANKGSKDESYQFCQKAIQLNPDNHVAQVNLGDILRQLGKQAEAIKNTWNQIYNFTIKQQNQQNYSIPEPVDVYQLYQNLKQQQQAQEQTIQKQVQDDSDQNNTQLYKNVNDYTEQEEQKKNNNNNDTQNEKIINILCVKWGTRYDAEYVNKLYRGIKRNCTKVFNFYCFTDDAANLDNNIIVKELEQGWERWWGKVTLFNIQMTGKMFYIDLDMIITANIDNLLTYEGPFAILKTDDIACEKDNKNGYNSSIMIWQSNKDLKNVYEELSKNYKHISKFIVRFDFWLEMMIKNADFLQDLFPDSISDYTLKCQNCVPEKTAIVSFPRKPKPDEYPAEWIKQYWI